MEQATQEVLVVGYPKSGNTWLTRLVAELISCPVKRFFGQPGNPEIAIEGSNHQSNDIEPIWDLFFRQSGDRQSLKQQSNKTKIDLGCGIF